MAHSVSSLLRYAIYLTPVVTASLGSRFKYGTNHAFSLAPLNAADNSTISNVRSPSDVDEPICDREIRPQQNLFLQLFKRADGCTSTIDEEEYACPSGSFCCTNPADSYDVWCCSNTAGCGPATGGSMYCTHRVKWITITDYTTEYTTVYSTETVSAAGDTKWTTVVSTALSVVTRTDLDTATDITWATVTEKAGNQVRAQPTAVVPARSIAVPSSTTLSPIASAARIGGSKPMDPVITPPPEPLFRQILRRQTMRTDTSTTFVYETLSITSTIHVTSHVFFPVTRTATSVTTRIFTSAVNAKTTVHVTSTLTKTEGQPLVIVSVTAEPGPGVNSGAPSATIENLGPSIIDQSMTGGGTSGTQQEQSPSATGAVAAGSGSEGKPKGGMTRSAQISIGVGTAVASLIICLLVAFLLRRRHKNKKKEVAEMINTAVVAATTAQSPPPMDHKHSIISTAGPIPEPPGSPGSRSDRYSDLMPMYHSGATSPAPIYQYSSPSPPAPGYEMSATPSQQFVYPAPPNEMYVRTQSPVELHYPVPAEAPNIHSPRPVYRQYQPQ